jgi:hypothetical protein
MSSRLSLLGWLALAATVAASACTDLPTSRFSVPQQAPVFVRSPPFTRSSAGQDAPYYCDVSRKIGDGLYRYGSVALHFPASEIAPDSSTADYRYRVYADGAQIVLAANCHIPNTEAALRRMNRYAGGRGEYRTHGSEKLDQGILAGDAVPIDGMIITICMYGGEYPWCHRNKGSELSSPECPALDPTCSGFGGGSDWSWGGTGEDPLPPEYDDGTGREKCIRDAAKHCITRVLTLPEWEELGNRIEEIREDIGYCKGAKDALRGLFARGVEAKRIRVWDGFDRTSRTRQRIGQNLSDADGRYIEYDSFWLFDNRTRQLLVHEGLHYWINLNAPTAGTMETRPDGMTNEEWVELVDQNCLPVTA